MVNLEPDMNYSKIHSAIAIIICILAIFGIKEVIEIIFYVLS